MEKINSIKKIIKHRIAINIYWWIILFLFIYIPVMIFNNVKFALLVSAGVILPCIIPVYINFYLLDRFFKKGKYLIYIILFIVLVVSSGIFAQYFIYLVVPMSEDDTFAAFADPLFLILLTSGVRYYWQGIKLQMQVHEAQAKQYKAELDLLKYQVNPHFFFNTLNNLFALARKQKDQSTAKGIIKLSQIMRYIIYDSNVEKIEIEKEIEQINNFIELQKLRFSKQDDISINLTVEGNIDQQKITPMLLIPFVENAIKHGISFKNRSPIDIHLILKDEHLFFSVRNNINRLRQNRDDQNSGIGLKNVKRRLELLYPQRHQIKIENKNEKYEVLLSIKL